MTILTIHHNNIGRPILLWPAGVRGDGVEYPAQWYEGRSGISPFDPDSDKAVDEWVRALTRYGAAIVTDDRTDRPWNHNIIGIGAGHSDVDWCESRFQAGSMAVYYENERGYVGGVPPGRSGS